MCKIFMIKLVITLITSLSITGCVTTKISPEVRQKFNQTQIEIQKNPVSILVNPCLITNELGRDSVLIEATQLSSHKFLQTFTQQLEAKGVQVQQSATPFICGAMSEEQIKKYDVQVQKSSTRQAIQTYPLLNTQSTGLSAEQQQAILTLNQFTTQMDTFILTQIYNKKANFPKPNLNDQTVKILRDWAKSPYIFIITIDGLDASVGSKLATGTLSFGVTLATMGAGSGIVTTYFPKEGQSYGIRLFDLNKKEFVWSKGAILKGNVFSTKNHSLEANNVLTPLFEIE